MTTDISATHDRDRAARRGVGGRTVALAVATASLAVIAVLATTRPVVPSSQPDGWTRCTNDAEGFSVAYPKGWYSWGPGAQSCSLFDEAPIEGSPVFLPNWDIVRGRGGPLHPTTALQVVPYDGPFEYTLRQLTEHPIYEHVLSKRSTRVAGRRAVVVETRATGVGFYEKGARAYWYVIDVRGKGWMVSTVAQGLRAPRYAEFKSLVDRAVRSLEFVTPSSDDQWHDRIPSAALALVVLGVAGFVLKRRRSTKRRNA